MQLDRKQQLIILLLAGVILFGAGYRYAQIKERGAVNESVPLIENVAETKTKEIQVHVVGAVARPGVYKMPQGARIVEAVNLAGLLEDAEQDALKLASPINDGQTIIVPYKASAAENSGAGAAVPGVAAGTAGTVTSGAQAVLASNSGQVNINTADASQLSTLPGIGPALSQRIIQYRETNGDFSSIEEIKKVSGIGDKKYEDLKDKITTY